MDKCEGCPMYDPRHYSGTGNPWCNWLGGNIASCHLTPDHQRIIDAMIRGAFDCGHCGSGKHTAYRPGEYVLCECKARTPQGDMREVGKWPCEFWRERKEGEDGM